MPTGYTLYIRDGKITTGKDFLKLCLRSFSICMEMRDEPLSSSIPVRFEVNPYYQKRYLEAVEERNEFRLMSFDKVRENLIEKHKEEMESIKESLDKCNAEDERYMKVRDEIEKWTPPTSEHENVKEFALKQIDMSLNTSVIKSLNDELNKELDISDEAVQKYIDDMNESYEKDVERAKKRWEEQIENTADKNIWMIRTYG